jgi:hypothetical protein
VVVVAEERRLHDGREERRASGAASGYGRQRARGGELANAMGGGRRGGAVLCRRRGRDPRRSLRERREATDLR